MFTLLSLAMNNEWDIQSVGNNDQISLLSSLNFFIYCFASKRFRASLRSLLAPLTPPKRSRDTSSTTNLPMSESSPLNQIEWYVRKISVNFFKVLKLLESDLLLSEYVIDWFWRLELLHNLLLICWNCLIRPTDHRERGWEVERLTTKAKFTM